ncbi:beta-4C adrenergic receptor-like [Orbicella faveolata]|uniref:beta-4C adrenergic receptor-like n=1 Tax=Orbicella faveolata TaxID=48498 RepID=UPI0009E4E9A4|nr:beta-4C adrenergic receptor-like [Orbicella faveolata]
MSQTLSPQVKTDDFRPPDDSSLILSDSTFFLCFTVAGFTLALLITVSSSVLLVTIFRESRRLLEKPPSLLITNLCVSDLVVGLIAGNLGAVQALYRYQQWPVPDELDVVVRVFLSLTLFVRSGTIVALSYDRYIAVAHPFQYRLTITKPRYKIFIALLWVVSSILCVLQLASIPEKIISIIYAHTHASMPMMLLTVIYFKLFRALTKRKRELRAVEIRNKATWDRQRKMVATILIVLTMFYGTVFPAFISLHLRYFCKSCEQSLTFKKLEIIFFWFLFLTSAVNPFVYAWREPKYRRGLKTCLARKRTTVRPNPMRGDNNSAVPVRLIHLKLFTK